MRCCTLILALLLATSCLASCQGEGGGSRCRERAAAGSFRRLHRSTATTIVAPLSPVPLPWLAAGMPAGRRRLLQNARAEAIASAVAEGNSQAGAPPRAGARAAAALRIAC